ncbi:cupin domain-containing protein [Streptosporangium sp. NPDC051022]|uniref:cupin domain-containing protein n=1 Tax=Streptosporangium sp. NPDC051022 TaxID=3155752 RepID=UPI00342FF5C8
MPRRVVTGHDLDGNSVFLTDGPPPVSRTLPDGVVFHEIWATDAMPAPIAPDEPEPGDRPLNVSPRRHGTVVRVVVTPPGGTSPMHRTRTVDYGVVLEGEAVLVLSDSERTMRPGDVFVQRGTDHRWENRSDVPLRILFVLLDGEFTGELLATLPPGALDTLLDDPPAH